jgi:hypothetical protein
MNSEKQKVLNKGNRISTECEIQKMLYLKINRLGSIGLSITINIISTIYITMWYERLDFFDVREGGD